MFRKATFVASQGTSFLGPRQERILEHFDENSIKSLLEDLVYHAKDVRESRTMTLQRSVEVYNRFESLFCRSDSDAHVCSALAIWSPKPFASRLGIMCPEELKTCLVRTFHLESRSCACIPLGISWCRSLWSHSCTVFFAHWPSDLGEC